MIPLYLVISLLSSGLFLSPVFALLKKSFLRQNYQGKYIPSGLGLLLILNFLAIIPFMHLFSGVALSMILLKGFLLGVIAFMGIADDFLGDSSRGIKGHVKVLIKEKRFTSGGLKAAVGLLSGFMLGIFFGGSFIEVVISALVFALSVNTFNLMDVRPGRSIKMYILFSFLIIIWRRDQAVLLITPILGAALRILPLDLGEEGMLGDIGSNLLGASVGFFLVVLLDLPIKILILGALIVIQWVGDHISFSKLIERNNALRYIDNLGRK